MCWRRRWNVAEHRRRFGWPESLGGRTAFWLILALMLVQAAGLAGEDIGEMEVGFRLGPRLNAAGRMGHAKDAVELFTTATGPRAAELAALLSKQNDARRKVENGISDAACRMAEEAGMTGPSRRSIVDSGSRTWR